jgi:hypothetical protein
MGDSAMPDVVLSFPERAALLALMTFVDEVANPEIKARYGFSIDGKIRERLRTDGYIADRRDGTRPGRPFVLSLEEKGWLWCRDEFSTPPANEMPKSYRLLYGVLNNVDRYMRRSECQMADFFSAEAATAAVADPVPVTDNHALDADSVEKRIRSAYQELVREPRGWIGLRLLREKLADLPQGDVDEGLLRLDLLPGVYLQPESDQKNLTDADRAAAIRIGGELKHLLSIEGA